MTGSFFGYPVIDFLHPFITDGGKIFGVPLNAEQVFFCVSPSFGSSVRGRCIDFHIGNRIIRHHCFPVAGIGQNMSFADNVGQRCKRCNKYIVCGQFFGFMFQRRLGVLLNAAIHTHAVHASQKLGAGADSQNRQTVFFGFHD